MAKLEDLEPGAHFRLLPEEWATSFEVGFKNDHLTLVLAEDGVVWKGMRNSTLVFPCDRPKKMTADEKFRAEHGGLSFSEVNYLYACRLGKQELSLVEITIQKMYEALKFYALARGPKFVHMPRRQAREVLNDWGVKQVIGLLGLKAVPGDDPVSRSLEDAPLDDEPETDEERARANAIVEKGEFVADGDLAEALGWTSGDPMTPEEYAALDRARADVAAGRVISHEDLKRKLGWSVSITKKEDSGHRLQDFSGPYAETGSAYEVDAATAATRLASYERQVDETIAALNHHFRKRGYPWASVKHEFRELEWKAVEAAADKQAIAVGDFCLHVSGTVATEVSLERKQTLLDGIEVLRDQCEAKLNFIEVELAGSIAKAREALERWTEQEAPVGKDSKQEADSLE